MNGDIDHPQSDPVIVDDKEREEHHHGTAQLDQHEHRQLVAHSWRYQVVRIIRSVIDEEPKDIN